MKKLLCFIVAVALLFGAASWFTTNQNFYNVMCSIENGYAMPMGDVIPSKLKKLESVYRGAILETRKDTVYLTSRYPNLADEVNRYPIYVLQDNNNRAWALYREPAKNYKYYLMRNDSLVVKKDSEEVVSE